MSTLSATLHFADDDGANVTYENKKRTESYHCYCATDINESHVYGFVRASDQIRIEYNLAGYFNANFS